MSALRSMVAWDVRLQARYGFYAVYAVLTVAFVVGLRAVGPALRTEAAVLLVVTDPTVLGFYFVAALVLYEKEEGVLDALVTSPLGDRGYLASKVLTLSLLAVVAATVVATVGHGSPSAAGLPVLVLGVALSSSLFVLVGVVAVARYDSVNAYFLGAVGWGSVLFLPLFGYVGVVETPLFYLLPAQPALLLVEGGFRSLAPWEVAYGVGYLAVGNVVAYALARRTFRRHVVRGGDPGRRLGGDGAGPGSGWSSRLRSRSPLAGLVLADLRNWVRDPMLLVAATGPLALALVVRVGAPRVADLAAPTVDLPAFYPVVGGSLVLFGPAIYGFVVGMFLLEDREQGVLAAYRVSPLSARGYLLYRGVSAYLLSVAAVVPALALVGVVAVPPAVLLGSAAVGGLAGPAIALVFGALAANTIEGLALSKLVNLVVLAPAVTVAVVPEPLQFVAGVLPTYWPLKALVTGVAGDPAWPLFLLVGVVTHLLSLALLARVFARRVD